MPKLIFMVYDSRSGSTLFSREVTKRFNDVYVTPEIGFDTLFRIGEEKLAQQGWATALKEAYSGRDFTNLDLSFEKVLEVVENNGNPLTLANGVKAIIFEFAREHKRNDSKWIIIKNGSHLRYWKTIQSLFGDETYFIHVVRDPRAVISSKMRTPRPYFPYENMAWAGVVVASLRWRLYVDYAKQITQSGVNIHELKYEDITSKIEEEMISLSQYLTTPQTTATGLYKIPEKEKAIHKLVLTESIEPKRINAWKNELSNWDRYKIETVCNTGMQRLGYETMQNLPYPLRIVACITDLPNIALGVIRHYLRYYRQLNGKPY